MRRLAYGGWFLVAALLFGLAEGLGGWAAPWPSRDLPEWTAAFESANQDYEQGRYEKAAGAYEQLIQQGAVSPVLYLNLGNACYKAGQPGRAIAAYRTGLMLAPRDPNLRFNVQFVREKAVGDEAGGGASRAERFLASLTLDEWAMLFALFFWLWFLLLAVREIRWSWRKPLRGYLAGVGGVTALLAVILIAAVTARSGRLDAVVAVPEAVVRYGPLEVSQVRHQLRDGVEVRVLDEKPGPEIWLLVRDGAGREGWLRRDEVILLPPGIPRAQASLETAHADSP